MPVASANPAVAVIHDTKVVTAVAINIDDGPSHTLVRSEITKPLNDADEYNSAAKSSQAAAAVIIGPDPGPVYINPELTSGGNAAKSSILKAEESAGRDRVGGLGGRIRPRANPHRVHEHLVQRGSLCADGLIHLGVRGEL